MTDANYYEALRVTRGTDPKPIDADRFNYWLEVLPPERWVRLGDCESFMVSECVTDDLYQWAARVGHRHYELIAPRSTLHTDIMRRISELQEFTDKVFDAYLGCALWSSYNEFEEPLCDQFDKSDISAQSRADALEDVQSFIEDARDDLKGLPPQSVGHDLWLTRNGHGAGFWDRGLGAAGDRLTEIAESLGSRYAYVGDDGQIHIQ